MQVLSVGPVRTGSSVWQQRGSFILAIVCKTTYWLKPGEAVIAPEQEAINEADDHWDDDPNRSVRAPCDLVPAKVRPEVTLVGYAYAPNKQLVRSLIARLIVGEVDKSIEVFCDRTFLSDGTLQDGPRFSRMRLSWERAGGGPTTNNPVGMRPDGRDAYGRRAVPNLQPIGMHVSSPDDFIPPVGFGPIAASWPSRADIIARSPAAVGEGLDGPSAIYYNAAPPDQLLSVLRENERIVLENLHPEHARLVTNLPGFRPAVFVDRGRGPAQRVPARADSLWIDADRGIATLTWRAIVPLARRDEPGRVLVGMEAPGHEMTFAAVAAGLVGDGADDEDDTSMETITSTISLNELSRGLPFGASAAPESRGLPFAATATPEVDPPPPRERMRSVSALDLPFQQSPAAAPPPPPAPPRPAWPTAPAPPVPRPPGLKPPPVPSAAGPASRPALTGTPPIAPAPKAPPVALAAPPFAAPPAPAAPTSAPPQPPPVVPPTVHVPPPVVLSAARAPGAEGAPTAGSPWASGTPGATVAPRETLGTAAAAAAAAAAGANAPKEAPSDGGALAASNEAAGVRPWSAPRRELRSVIATEEVADKPTVSRELLHLVFFEPSFVPRIRRVAAWKKLLSELEERGPDKAIDDVLAGKEAWEIEDRREIFEILARGERADERGLVELMDESIREDGKFATPIVLIGCEVEMPFDEIEVLRALSTAAAPLVGPTDESLKAAVEAADKFLGRAHASSAAPVIPEGLSNRIREAFVREKKSLPPDALDVQAERALLGGRHYQKRDVLGGTFLRLLLRMSAEGQPLVGYASEDIAKKLPMFRRFRARLIGELHPWQDQYEARRESLRILALGTVTYIDRNAAPAKN